MQPWLPDLFLRHGRAISVADGHGRGRETAEGCQETKWTAKFGAPTPRQGISMFSLRIALV